LILPYQELNYFNRYQLDKLLSLTKML